MCVADALFLSGSWASCMFYVHVTVCEFIYITSVQQSKLLSLSLAVCAVEIHKFDTILTAARHNVCLC